MGAACHHAKQRRTYLVEAYGYSCFGEILEKANRENGKISPSLRGFFTLNENLEQVNLITVEEAQNRMEAFLNEHP